MPTLTAALTAAFIPAAGAPTFKTATLKLVCKRKITIFNKHFLFLSCLIFPSCTDDKYCNALQSPENHSKLKYT